ncbi:MAG: pectinesterase family protein [Paludibacteraceae bacterium]
MKYIIKHILILGILSVNSFIAESQILLINGIPRDTSYTVYSSFIKEKKNFPFIQLVNSEVTAELITYQDIVYKKINKNRKLKLNIFRPKSSDILPAVLMIHGGGWNSGSPDLQKALAVNLARKGFVTITAEYRLIPEAVYPAGVDDLNDAVRWISNNAGKYAVDKNKIAVSGCSAGGQLASLMGTKNKDKLIKAIVSIDGISTFLDSATIERAQKARDTGSKMPVDAQWLGGTFNERSETWKDASALYFVNKNSAPVCFINSSIPRFHNGRDEHIRKLCSLNIYSEVHTFDKTPHTFWHFHPWHISTVNYAANFLNKVFFRQDIKTDKKGYDIVVAQDGSGDFRTVQEAINDVPDFRKKQTRIFIRNGYYREKIIIPETKDSLILVGEDNFKTVLSFNNFASKPTAFGDQLGTSGSASVYISPANFIAENITFENAAGPVGQAVAVIVRSDKARFVNCRFLGFQDTLYTHKMGSRQYYKNCFIEGTVDFIFGFSTAYFEECDIYCKSNGYVTAASTPQGVQYGYVFYHCKISGENPESFYLGRPWRPYAHVAFIECEMSNVIKPEGWDNWGKKTNEKTAQFLEYKNTGKGGNMQNKRIVWSKTLTESQLVNYSKEKVLGNDF